jgi:hypothetical protein
LAAGTAGEPPVHRYPVAFFQRNGSKQGAVAAAQVQRHGASGPLFRQGKVQLVHAGSVLRAEVQAVGAGVKFGAAALPANDLNLHTKPSFLLFLEYRAAAESYPVRTFFVNISAVRHFAGPYFSGQNHELSGCWNERF